MMALQCFLTTMHIMHLCNASRMTWHYLAEQNQVLYSLRIRYHTT